MSELILPNNYLFINMNKFYQIFLSLVMVIVLTLFSFATEALALNQDNSKELFKLGVAQLESHQYTEAIEHFFKP